MKSDFVSFVTHQLRTPLAGIRWMLELTAQEPEIPADAASYVQDAREAAQRLIQLVNDLLDVSRLEQGKLTVATRTVDLGELTREVLAETAGARAGEGAPRYRWPATRPVRWSPPTSSSCDRWS